MKNGNSDLPLEGINRGGFAGRFAADSESPAPRVAATTVEDADGFLLLGGSDHQSAASSPGRGYVYWRSTDTRRQISDFTDAEIQRRLDFLYHHSGVARRLIHGLAVFCGILTPQPNTLDEEWNEESFDSFQLGACSPEVFDAGGRFDFYLAQMVTNVSRFRAGRSLGVLTETPTGRARIAFYDPWQLDHRHRGASPEDVRTRRIVRGVEVNKMTRHLAYFLRDAENPDAPPLRVPASSAIYFGKFDNHGQVHPLSILAGAIVNMIDVAETRAAWKSQIKSAGRRGEVIEQDPIQNHVHGSGIGGKPVEVKVLGTDGKERTVELEQVYSASGEVMTLAPGQRYKLVTDDRPSANNLEFDRILVEDCANFAGLPPEPLFRIAGITGPAVRSIYGQLSRWILLEHLWQARWCHRFYVYSTAKEIKNGRLRKPIDPVSGKVLPWWRHSQCLWLGLPDFTIDKGKEGKLSITQLDAGLTTWADEWKGEGAFWKKRITQRIVEVGFAKFRAWKESKRLEELTDGEVSLDVSEVFKFANLGGSSAGSGASEEALAARIDELEASEENRADEEEELEAIANQAA